MGFQVDAVGRLVAGAFLFGEGRATALFSHQLPHIISNSNQVQPLRLDVTKNGRTRTQPVTIPTKFLFHFLAIFDWRQLLSALNQSHLPPLLMNG